jgi:thymidylate synthase (FAD)
VTGFVRLDSCMADDLSVVNSARVSFGRSSTEFGEAERGLVHFLMRERHGTPFEHNAFRFHVRCPIFVAREWMRHRIGSFNEFSGRYSEVPDGAWTPSIEAVRTQVGKPGAYTFEPVPESVAAEARDAISEANGHAWRTYQYLLSLGVAKEVARVVLPLASYTEFWWTVNARSLMNFLSLRTAETAQREIREYAGEVESLFAEKMPWTHRCWLVEGRIAP